MNAPGKVDAFKMDGKRLARALVSVFVARSKDSTRPHLRGVLVTVEADQVRFEATDGHRLHRVTLGLPPGDALTPGQYRAGGLAVRRLLAKMEINKMQWFGIVRLRPGDLGIATDRLPKLGDGLAPTAESVDINPSYLTDASEAAEAFGCPRLEVMSSGDSKALRFYGPGAFDGDTFEALVMPIQRPRRAVAYPTVLNPEAIGNPKLTPIVQLPQGAKL